MTLNIETQPLSSTPQSFKQQSLEKRRSKVATLLFEKVSVADIAKRLKISRGTVYNDFEVYSKTEQAIKLEVEWWQLYTLLKKENPSEAFRCLTRLYIKKREAQAKVEINVTTQQTTAVVSTEELQVKLARYHELIALSFARREAALHRDISSNNSAE